MQNTTKDHEVAEVANVSKMTGAETRASDRARNLTTDLTGAGFELRETHISWVFLGPEFVFKVKKPVNLQFLDFTTLENRRIACDAEVRLNRRLAPDVYIGVVALRRGPDGHHAFEAEEGERVDWAVKMKRLPDADRADIRLSEGRLQWNDLERAANRLAAFHEETRSNALIGLATVGQVRENVDENFAQTHETLTEFISPAEAAEIQSRQLNFIERYAQRFETRRESGRVCDGHGDLRLEHLYIDEESANLRFLDCIEFNERFRRADACADIAFLSMDLRWHGRADLSERFLAAYARAANDFELYGLVDFYESYRAFVRGKVAVWTLSSTTNADLRRRLRADARRYFLLANAFERAAVASHSVIAVGGLIASGKSSLADALGSQLACPVVDTDRTRKFMLNVAPTQRVYDGAWSNAYGLDFTRDVYAEVMHRADVVLSSGRSVIIDASFRTRKAREEAAALARRRGVPFFFVECMAPLDVLRARLVERQGKSTVSDGRLEIFDDFVAAWEPVDELSASKHCVIDTSGSIDDSLKTALMHVSGKEA